MRSQVKQSPLIMLLHTVTLQIPFHVLYECYVVNQINKHWNKRIKFHYLVNPKRCTLRSDLEHTCTWTWEMWLVFLIFMMKSGHIPDGNILL